MNSCKIHEKDNSARKRTILVYMAADNNLNSYLDPNINNMMSGLSASLTKNNDLVVYVDRLNQAPYLLHITESSRDTIRHYSDACSTAPSTLSSVIDDMIKLYPAESYGLVLWSHGTGWLPSSTHNFIDYYKLRLDMQARRMPMTKAFGLDMVPEKRWMNLEDLAEGIPAGTFDFIMFDACYMSSVELLYSLRGKTNWFIGSEIEIMADGFPYYEIMEDMFKSDYVSVCRKFYEYYDKQSYYPYRTAGIALVDASGLESLSKAFNSVLETATVKPSDLFQKDLQYVDRFNHKVLFDMRDYALNLKPSAESLNGLDDALGNCVVYCANTPQSVGEINLGTLCGLNAFVPVAEYENQINGYYRETDWYKAITINRR